MIILKIIRLYQKVFSFKKSCRFYPTCSEYMYEAIEKYGTVKGVWKGMKRISRCHPWNPGGIDEP